MTNIRYIKIKLMMLRQILNFFLENLLNNYAPKQPSLPIMYNSISEKLIRSLYTKEVNETSPKDTPDTSASLNKYIETSAISCPTLSTFSADQPMLFKPLV